MTEVAPRGSAQIVDLGDGRVAVSGSLVEVGAFLRRARERGVLAGSSNPQPTGEAGRFVVTARLLPVVAARPAPARRWYRRAGPVAAVIGAVLLVLAGVGYLLMLALANLMPILGVLAVVWLLAYLAGGTPVCTGLHCSGCRRH